jgi:hypothetical protein
MFDRIISSGYAILWFVFFTISIIGTAMGAGIWGVVGIALSGWLLWRNIRDAVTRQN